MIAGGERTMVHTICGIDCGTCAANQTCAGCMQTDGRPFGGVCVAAACCRDRELACCAECTAQPCALKEQVIAEFNALGIPDMEPVTELHLLHGDYINLSYTLSNGQTVQLLEDKNIYMGNQMCKKDSERCYGLAADAHILLVCEYGNGGSDAEIVVYQKRKWNCK